VTARSAWGLYERLTERALSLRRAAATARGDRARTYRAELMDVLRARDEMRALVEGDGR
jgi:hypothetical protein